MTGLAVDALPYPEAKATKQSVMALLRALDESGHVLTSDMLRAAAAVPNLPTPARAYLEAAAHWLDIPPSAALELDPEGRNA